MTAIEPPVCVALDVPTLAEAREVLNDLVGLVPLFKVGLELFCAEGPSTVATVLEAGAGVFLDLKVNDIPRTAAATVHAAGRLGATFVTIHGFGGREMIRAAVESAEDYEDLEVLVVSALTSLDDDRLREVGVVRGVREQALAVGELAAEQGARGLVLSPRELGVVRSALPHLLLATPGVRPAGSTADDHLRVLSPADAIIAGADLVVIGRPILGAADRVGAARALIDEVSQAEAQREAKRADDVDSLRDAEDADLEEEVDG